MRTGLADVVRLLVAYIAVGIIVGPIGYAMEGLTSTLWVLGGAFAWVTIFALPVKSRLVPMHKWVFMGGVICGSGWALGWPLARYLTDMLGETTRFLPSVSFQGMLPAFIFGIAAGVGGGLLGSIALGEKGYRYGLALGLTWGFVSGLSPYPFIAEPLPIYVALIWGLLGLAGALLGLPVGRSIGRLFRPTVLIFEELWPYLSAMTVPFSGFVIGYLVLVFVFAGFLGAIWRVDPQGAFSGLPPGTSFIDFLFFSVTTATGVGGPIVAKSGIAKLIVSAEAIFAHGWLIAVFAAVGAHLSPRFTQIAVSKEGSQG